MDKKYNIFKTNNVAKYMDINPHTSCIIQEVIRDPISEYRGYVIKLINNESSIIEVYSQHIIGIYIYNKTLEILGFEYNKEDDSFYKDNRTVKRIYDEEGDLCFSVLERSGELTYVDTVNALQNYWEHAIGRPFELETVIKAIQ